MNGNVKEEREREMSRDARRTAFASRYVPFLPPSLQINPFMILSHSNVARLTRQLSQASTKSTLRRRDSRVFNLPICSFSTATPLPLFSEARNRGRTSSNHNKLNASKKVEDKDYEEELSKRELKRDEEKAKRKAAYFRNSKVSEDKR